MKSSKRDNRIDAAKFIAILVVMLNHSGLVLGKVNFWGGMFYVPLFFVAAGYTYRLKDEKPHFYYMLEKGKRLIIPYLATNIFLGAFFLAYDSFRGGSIDTAALSVSLTGMLYARNQMFKTEPIVSLMMNLNAPTWFLPALFMTLMAGDILFRVTKGNKKKGLVAVVALFILMMIYDMRSGIILLWSLDIVPFLLILFLAGYGMKKGHAPFGDMPVKGKVILTSVNLVALIVFAYLNGSYNLSISNFGKYRGWSAIPALICALSSVYILFTILNLTEKYIPVFNRILARASRHNMTLLCLHYFLMSMFVQWVDRQFNMEDMTPGGWQDVLIRLSSMVFAFLFCMVLDLIFGKVKKLFEKREEF